MERFEKGCRWLGTITHAKSLPLIEALGYTGLDFLVFDMEHCAMSTDEMARCLTAASAAGLKALVRVPDGSRSHILHMLDLGADGVLIGPYDLSMDMDIPGQFDDPRHMDAITRIYRACQTTGKLALNFCGDAAKARTAFQQGCDAAVLGIDLLMLIQAYQKEIDSARG